MGFTIDYGYGWLGTIIIVLGLGAIGILAAFLFAAVKGAREDVIEEDRDAEQE